MENNLTLGQFCNETFFEEGRKNIAVVLEIETKEIQLKYGRFYDGELIPFVGVNGRLSDIPAYLACETVKNYEICVIYGETKYYVYI